MDFIKNLVMLVAFFFLRFMLTESLNVTFVTDFIGIACVETSKLLFTLILYLQLFLLVFIFFFLPIKKNKFSKFLYSIFDSIIEVPSKFSNKIKSSFWHRTVPIILLGLLVPSALIFYFYATPSNTNAQALNVSITVYKDFILFEYLDFNVRKMYESTVYNIKELHQLNKWFDELFRLVDMDKTTTTESFKEPKELYLKRMKVLHEKLPERLILEMKEKREYKDPEHFLILPKDVEAKLFFKSGDGGTYKFTFSGIEGEILIKPGVVESRTWEPESVGSYFGFCFDCTDIERKERLFRLEVLKLPDFLIRINTIFRKIIVPFHQEKNVYRMQFVEQILDIMNSNLRNNVTQKERLTVWRDMLEQLQLQGKLRHKKFSWFSVVREALWDPQQLVQEPVSERLYLQEKKLLLDAWDEFIEDTFTLKPMGSGIEYVYDRETGEGQWVHVVNGVYYPLKNQ